MTPLELATEAARVAINGKAVDVVIQDLRGLSDICNYQVICSGMNTKQTKALAQAIEEHMRSRFGTKTIAVEGKEAGNWILMDYGGGIIHIFERSLRDYYAIDKLWPKAISVPY